VLKQKSKILFSRAQRHIPGGVNSPVRAFRSVGGEPRFIRSGKGSHVTDVDGRHYIDYLGSWGPLILGHCPAKVQSALRAQLALGTSFGASTENEVVLAEMIAGAIPSIEKVRLVNSGTEATMSAIRLARAFTGRNKIIKFDGCYHGHVDSLLVKAGSGVATLGLPDSAGVQPQECSSTFSIPYNDADTVQRALELNRSEIAAVIVEPVAGSAGVLVPPVGYLERLRAITEKHGILLIFDEVITGFGRLGKPFGWQRLGVVPDLVTTAKGINSGTVPMGAVFARAGLYEAFMQGPQQGIEFAHGYTYSAHPLACAASLATLDVYRDEGLLERVTALEKHWEDALHSLKGVGAVMDVRNIGLMGAVELEPRAGAPGARGFDTHVKTFFEEDVLIRFTGDILAMSPPLIVSTSQIDEIVERLRRVLERIE